MKKHARELIKLIKEVCGEPKAGAEIGVYKGETSVVLIEAFPDCKFVFVDPWQEWGPGDSYHDHHKMGKKSQDEWDELYTSTHRRIINTPGYQPFDSMVLRTTSQKAVSFVEDKSLDFVFIDADHTYESVKQDIELWLPKTRKLICGHDYRGVKDRKGRGWGVSQAVHEVFGEENILKRPSRIWAYAIKE